MRSFLGTGRAARHGPGWPYRTFHRWRRRICRLGIREGSLRKICDAAFAGRALLPSLGAQRPGHLIDLFVQDLRATLDRMGGENLGELRTVAVRHDGAFRVGNA